MDSLWPLRALQPAAAAYRRAATVAAAALGTEGLPSRARLLAQEQAGAALNNLGNILQGSARLPESLENYAQALHMKPQDPEAWNNRAVALFALVGKARRL